jgi:uncharacterized protein YbcI
VGTGGAADNGTVRSSEPRYGATMTEVPRDDAAGLTRAGQGVAEIADGGALRAAISNAMVGMKAKWYGKGPERARTYLADDHVFVVMEGGLTRNEETLLAAGEAEAVRQYRLLFQATMRETTMTTLAELTGRPVLDYHSQIVFDPPRALEWFVLGTDDGGDHMAATRKAATRARPRP